MSMYTKHSYDLQSVKLLHFLRDDLGLECAGIALGVVEPGKGYPFWHSHEKQEEVYACIAGSLTLLVDDDELTLHTGDFVRVAPEANRAVGNRTKEPGTILIIGAMPFAGYQGADGKTLIQDGQRAELDAPDWSVAE